MDVKKVIKSIPVILTLMLGGISAVISVGVIFGSEFEKLPVTYIAPLLFALVFTWLIEAKNVIVSAVMGVLMVAAAAFSTFADLDHEVTIPIYTSFCAVGWCALWKGRTGGSLAVPLILFIVAAIPCFIGNENSAGIVTAVLFSVLFLAQNVHQKRIKINELSSWSSVVCMFLAVITVCLVAIELTVLVDNNEPDEDLNRTVKGWATYKSIGQYGANFSLEELGFNYSDGTLGGPTAVGDSTVFKVKTDRSVNLRCKVDNVYTGTRWKKVSPHYNYHYINWMTGSDYEDIFCTNLPATRVPDGVFVETEITVTPVQKNMKSLATPVSVGSIDFGDNKGSIIYNNLGEVFSTDHINSSYKITAQIPNVGSDAFENWMTENADSFTESEKRMSLIYELYCQPPTQCDALVSETAKEVMGEGNSYVKAKRLESWLATQYKYDLNIKRDYYYDDDFVSNFLMSGRGYCVHFASAMTVMLRTQGIPARYVSGYSVKQSEGETVEVTEDCAHAWCEVYFEGVGWVPFEPTASLGASGSEQPDETVQQDEHVESESVVSQQQPENEPLTEDPVENERPEQNDEAKETDNNSKSEKNINVFVAVILILMYIYIVGRRIADQRRCAVKSWHKIECALIACGSRRAKNEALSAFAHRVCNAADRFGSCGLVEAANATECAVYSQAGDATDANEKCFKKLMASMNFGEKIVFAFLKLVL